jgi:mRNA interferase MazF
MSGTPRRCEIFWANLEPVKGSEQGGFRPVLIISNNLMNESASVVIAIPMTRSGEKAKNGPFNIPYKASQLLIDEEAVKELAKQKHYYAPVDGVILCNQSRTIAKARLICKLGAVSDKEVIRYVEEAIKHSYALEGCDICGIPLRSDGLICVRCRRPYRTICTCGAIIKLEFSYCPICGRGVKGESSK